MHFSGTGAFPGVMGGTVRYGVFMLTVHRLWRDITWCFDLLTFVTWHVAPWPLQPGWRYDRVGFYCHFNDIPAQELKGNSLKSLQKTKKLGKVLASSFDFFSSNISTHVVVLSEASCALTTGSDSAVSSTATILTPLARSLLRYKRIKNKNDIINKNLCSNVFLRSHLVRILLK